MAAPLATPVQRARDTEFKKQSYQGQPPPSELACCQQPACTIHEEALPHVRALVDTDAVVPTERSPARGRGGGRRPDEGGDSPSGPESPGGGFERTKSEVVRQDDPGPPQDSFPAAFLGPPLSFSAQAVKSVGDASGYPALPFGADTKAPYAATSAPKYDTTTPSKAPYAATTASKYDTTPALPQDDASGDAAGDDAEAAVVAGAAAMPAAAATGADGAYAAGGGLSAMGGTMTGGGGAGKGEHDRGVAALVQAAAVSREFKGRYTLGKRLNAGAQGVTYLATATFSGRQVVVKKPNDSKDVSDYTLLSTKTHPHIVRVYELFQDPCETFIVMEYGGGGDLFHAIEALKMPSQNWTCAMFRQVVWGVRYLHDYFEESHNDIKPENIFLDRPSASNADVPRAMIGDFGCVKKIGRARNGGDPRYRAPETFDYPAFGRASDVWSLGVTLFEIASGGLMVYLNTQNLSSWDKFRKSGKWDMLLQNLTRGALVPLEGLKGTGPEMTQLKELLGGMLSPTINRRWSLSQVLDAGWMKLSTEGSQVAFHEETAVQLRKRSQRHVLDIALLNLVGSMLQGESIRHYQVIWDRYDLDASGAMQLEEFTKLVEDLGLNKEKAAHSDGTFQVKGMPAMSAQDVFALADGNHSGAIEFNEFIGLMFNPDELSDQERMEFFKHAFLTLAGEDGKINAEELAGVFANNSWTQAKASAEVVQRLFKELDTDDNGFVDYSEFAAYMENL
eukprot:CAMPEP_0177335622 /NCGR_PEP_ID=MMETSP0368-20130122/23348_1 /TAXON_ID=447022 ORGANISM="Scrippsiella hangoei-like, Strain SHHI-4" /NCGR_SAMPLE_ID=MMETSP0368 /ASSEMBLY_ACC=CAM_ASM_000363 /LENGTH=733 /DNA_ID=CAMNT_0018796415 /DNA_START=39 /DNA_END=2240 /DNA_ORIENTATION=+